MLRQFSQKFKKSSTVIFSPRLRAYHSASTNAFNTFLTEYFHRYQFLAYGSLNIQNVSSMLFNAKPIHDHAFGVVKIEITPKFDPALALLTKVTNSDKTPMGFNVYPTHHKQLSIISPTGMLPTHIALRFRDALEEQGNRTVTDIIDIRNCVRAKMVKDAFKFKLDLASIPEGIGRTEKPDTYEKIKTSIPSLVQDETDWKNKIDIASGFWSQLTSEKQQELMDVFYQSYYRSYVHSIMRFEVHDVKWNAYNGLNVLSQPYNKASQFMEFSQYRHSLVSRVFPGNISGGGFNMNCYCPGVQFLRSMGRQVDQDDVNIRNARSCIPYNGFTPYWMMIYLKEALDALDIPTSPLEMPLEMRNAIGDTSSSSRFSR